MVLEEKLPHVEQKKQQQQQQSIVIKRFCSNTKQANCLLKHSSKVNSE